MSLPYFLKVQQTLTGLWEGREAKCIANAIAKWILEPSAL